MIRRAAIRSKTESSFAKDALETYSMLITPTVIQATMRSKQTITIIAALAVSTGLLTAGSAVANTDIMTDIELLIASLQQKDNDHDAKLNDLLEKHQKQGDKIKKLQKENDKQQKQIDRLKDYRSDSRAGMSTMHSDMYTMRDQLYNEMGLLYQDIDLLEYFTYKDAEAAREVHNNSLFNMIKNMDGYNATAYASVYVWDSKRLIIDVDRSCDDRYSIIYNDTNACFQNIQHSKTLASHFSEEFHLVGESSHLAADDMPFNHTTYVFPHHKFTLGSFGITLDMLSYMGIVEGTGDEREIISYHGEPLSVTITTPNGDTYQSDEHNEHTSWRSPVYQTITLNADDPAGVYTWHITEYPQINGTVNLIHNPAWQH